jgi:N-acetylgalactosamine kinase
VKLKCPLCVTGCAKHIQFSPLRSEDVKLPDGAVFVIAHSLAVLNKAKTSDFNCRVAECRLAAQVTHSSSFDLLHHPMMK